MAYNISYTTLIANIAAINIGIMTGSHFKVIPQWIFMIRLGKCPLGYWTQYCYIPLISYVYPKCVKSIAYCPFFFFFFFTIFWVCKIMEDLRLKPVNKLCAINHKEKKKKENKDSYKHDKFIYFFLQYEKYITGDIWIGKKINW